MKKLNIAIGVLVIALTIFTFDGTLSLSRYMRSIDSLGSLEIAKPILNITSGEITKTINPTNNVSVSFIVSNYETDEINDLKLKYYLIFSLKEEKFPVRYELYSVDEDDNLTEVLLENNKSDYFTLDKEVHDSQEFILKVYWDESDISYTYQNLSDYIKINAYVEQL